MSRVQVMVDAGFSVRQAHAITGVIAATVSAANAVATVASVNTALTAIENNIADLTAKVNALAAVVRTFGFIAP